MVVIRLARGGAKKAPFYHIVAADRRVARDGRFIERLGYFNPLARGQETRLNLNQERIEYWMGKGAQPSARVTNILKAFKKDPETTMKAGLLTKAESKKAQQEADAAAAKKQLELAKKAEAEEKAKAEAEAAAKAAEEKKAEAAKPEETAAEAPAEEAAAAETKEAKPEAPAEKEASDAKTESTEATKDDSEKA